MKNIDNMSTEEEADAIHQGQQSLTSDKKKSDTEKIDEVDKNV